MIIIINIGEVFSTKIARFAIMHFTLRETKEGNISISISNITH